MNLNLTVIYFPYSLPLHPHQDFLNGVCSNVIHMDKKKLKYYGGNYDAFVRTRLELLENQMKQYQWEQDQIAHMKVNLIFLEPGINNF